MTRTYLAVLVLVTLIGVAPARSQTISRTNATFEISYDVSLDSGPITGRIFVIVSKDDRREPRLQAGAFSGSVPFFGVDANALKPGVPARVDMSARGFPINLNELPAGDYYVQALFNVYTEVHRKDGHVIWVHRDQGEGQQWRQSPGNLVSDVQRVHLDPATGFNLKLILSRKLPPVNVPPDTTWLKRVKIQSTMLSEFWGYPVYLGATVLLPKGYEEHRTQKYPAIYVQGHFYSGPPFGFSELRPPTPETPEQRRERLSRSARETPYEFYQSWTSDEFPRMIAVTFEHPTPFYDASYAVNSANNGPYADALLKELIPYLEEQFRIIPQPYARVLTGWSTGGWEALALQIHHPQFFNGTWALAPDSVDFRRYQVVDIYRDENAIETSTGDWARLERPAFQNVDGQVTQTMREIGRAESVLGGARSGEYFAAYDAAWGPVGQDGYPRPLWDRLTGKIDRDVAVYMRDNGFDLRYYLEKNWATIGRDLAGKIHVYVSDMDPYYLHLAVYLLEDLLKSTHDPAAAATFEYGRPMKPHGWQPVTNAELIRMMASRINQTAPGTVVSVN